MRTEASPEAQQIYDELILVLLDEFRKIRETLPHAALTPNEAKNIAISSISIIPETVFLSIFSTLQGTTMQFKHFEAFRKIVLFP